MRPFVTLTVLLGLAWAVLLALALRDLVAQPTFSAVLRLVVEGVAAAVTVAWSWRRTKP